MLDFAQLPPEVNSALMYAGPGSGPMLAAAAAWEALAAELQTTASTYDALITGLADGPWQGSSAASMVAAATPQVAWLRSTAGQAEQAGSQAVAAASAYEAAFFATVPPPEIAANRALLMALLATNFLGQNTAAIAATEAQYAEMWAQDAAAMYGYAGASAAATQLSPFNPAAQTINPAGLASQAASVGQAVSGAANAQALTDIPKALFGLSGIFTNEPPWLTDLGKALGLTGHTWSSDGSGLIVGGVLGDFVQGVTGSAELDASVAMDTFGKWVSPARLMVTQFKDYFGLAHDLPKWASEGAKAAGEAAKALPGFMVLSGRRSAMFRRDDVAALSRRYVAECLAVARAEGARLDDDVVDEVVRLVRSAPQDMGTSMLADRAAHRPLEWDLRNGVIVRKARAHGLATPISDVLVPLLAAASDGPG